VRSRKIEEVSTFYSNDMKTAATVGVEISSGRKTIIFYRMKDDKNYEEIENLYCEQDNCNYLFDLAEDYVLKAS
jgi:hypothetical protein